MNPSDMSFRMALRSPDLEDVIMSLRLVKVPDAAPPYDCEAHGAGCPASTATMAASSPGQGLTPEPDPGSPAAGAPTVPAAVHAADRAEALAWQFAQVIVEIMAGLRPPKQLIGLTTDRAREQARRLAPLLASGRRPRIQRIVTSRPAAGVAEMTVIVSTGPRSRALAMRWEHRAGRAATPGLPARPHRWLCTAIEAG